MQCLGRLVNDKYFGWFGDGKHKFHLEIRCSNMKLPNTDLCGRCHTRPRFLGKGHPTLLHNLITEPIPPWSHIFGGEWYQAKVAIYGEPSEEEMARGKKAKEMVTTPGEKMSIPAPMPPVIPSIQVPKESQEESPKETPKRKKRERQTTTQSVPQPTNVPTQAIESSEPYIDNIEVKKILVRRLEIDGTLYFLENSKEKVYGVGADKRPTNYLGRWNSRNQTIRTDVSDSENEE